MSKREKQSLSVPVQVREVTIEDVPSIATLHQQVFPDYFLAHMGQSFLERFYREFVDFPENYGCVALYNNDVIGFVVGTSNPAKLYSHFYRRNFFSLAWIVTGRLLIDPFVRNNIAARMVHLRFALRSLPGFSRRHDVAQTPGAPSIATARLLSIGVDSQVRGSGVADRMVRYFCEQLQRNSITVVGLSVRTNNHRAIAFYERTGWKREYATETAFHFLRSVDEAESEQETLL